MGRERELAGLGAALERAADRRPAVVLVAGESGVGKTRLVSELAARARDQGARVLAGDCVDLGDGELAYAPIVSALRGLSPDELGSGAAGLAPLLPQLDAPEAGHESALSQGRVFELLLGLLGRLGEAQPLVLVFEDVHWADRSSRDFLSFFVRNARHQRVLLVATYRTDELHRRHPLRALVAEAERAPIVERVALERFTREEMVGPADGDPRPPARGAPGRRALRPRRGQPVLHRGAGRRRGRRARAGQPRRRAHAARRGAQPARSGRRCASRPSPARA